MKFFPVLGSAKTTLYLSHSIWSYVRQVPSVALKHTHTLVKRKKGVKIELLFLWRGKLKILLDTVLFTGGTWGQCRTQILFCQNLLECFSFIWVAIELFQGVV